MTLINRRQYPYFLSILLIAVTAGIAFSGYFAFKNLNDVVDTIVDKIRPNKDLALMVDISNHLDDMENNIETYVIDKDPIYIDAFEVHTEGALETIAKLKLQESSGKYIEKLDSLESFISQKNKLLIQIANLNNQSFTSAIKNIQSQIEKNNSHTKYADSTNSEDKNLIKRIFKRNKKSLTQPSIQFDQINNQLDSLLKIYQSKAYGVKMKELTLFRDLHDIDNQINGLLGTLEHHKINEIISGMDIVEDQIAYTNLRIKYFSIVASILLITTLVILSLYVTKVRKHQLLLSEARKNAITLAQQKEQFLANMSHEIKTPMNAISGFTKLLLDSKLDQKQQEYISIINRSSKHLVYIVNDVLDYTRMQSGKFRLQKVIFSPEELLNDVIQLHKSSAEKKAIALTFIQENLPSGLLGDPTRLTQIISNLLDNSIKYTESGGVTLSATFDEEGRLCLQIEDSGKGIPQEMQKKIFEAYEQVNETDSLVGSGLGLSIVKKLVLIQNGEISVDSVPNKGTKFLIKIPYSISNHVADEKVQKTVILGPLKILIADDEVFNRKLLREILSSHPVEIEEVMDGLEAYNLLNKTHFDIALIDYKMPGMNGPDVAKKLRSENGINSNIPFIGLTATVSGEEIIVGNSTHINVTLKKPFDVDELLLFIQELTVENNKVESEKSEKSKQTTTEFSLSGLKNMVGEEFAGEMVETFIASSQENLILLKQFAIEEKWVEIADIIHKIVSPARHLKANELVSMLKKVEMSAREGHPIQPEQIKEIERGITSLNQSLRAYIAN